MRPMAQVLANRGIASWNVEYRRVGHPGGGWPGSFRDLADGTDFVRTLAASYPVDAGRMALVGHSSGGYFAAWLAGRRNLPSSSPLTGVNPVSAVGMVILDAFLDARVIDSRGVDGRLFCDEPVHVGLLHDRMTFTAAGRRDRGVGRRLRLSFTSSFAIKSPLPKGLAQFLVGHLLRSMRRSLNRAYICSPSHPFAARQARWARSARPQALGVRSLPGE